MKHQIDYAWCMDVEHLINYMYESLNKDDYKSNALYFAPNIVLLGCNIIDLCKLASSKYSFLKSQANNLIELVVQILVNYIKSIDDEFKLRLMIFEKDFENRDSIDLISKFLIFPIMELDAIETITQELWVSLYDIKSDILETSSAYTILKSGTVHNARDYIADYLFTNWKYRTLDNFKHNMIQFKVWSKSMKSRFVQEALFIIIIALTFQYFLIQATKAAESAAIAYAKVTNAGSSVSITETKKFEEKAYEFYFDMQVTVYLGYIAL